VCVGQGHWVTLLADGLGRFTSATASAVPIDSATDALRLLSRRAFEGADVIVVVGFRPGAHTLRGRAFDFIFTTITRRFSRASIVYFWIGTDVMNAVRDAQSGQDIRRFRKLTGGATHLADAESLKAELETIGVHADVAWMPAPNIARDEAPSPLPDDFKVLAYVPDNRFGFYGGPTLVEVARRLPEIAFRVVSGTGSWLGDPPPNLIFLGRLASFQGVYESSSCLVRTVEHDGTSCMVLEALASARPVIYTQPFPHTRLVRFGDADDLEQAIREIRDDQAASPSTLDWEGVEFARSLSDERTCYEAISARLRESLSGARL
jgi:hypothetical protein